jgi:hypothetical protein
LGIAPCLGIVPIPHFAKTFGSWSVAQASNSAVREFVVERAIFNGHELLIVVAESCKTYLFRGQGLRGLARTRSSKKFVPGSLIGVKDIDFVGRPEAETP